MLLIVTLYTDIVLCNY